MKNFYNFYCYLLFCIILLTNQSVFAAEICNATGIWLAVNPPASFALALLQEGAAISGWWYPYPIDCGRPEVVGTIKENGQIFLQGEGNRNPGCPVMMFTAEVGFLNCDTITANLWSSSGDIGRYIYKKLPSHLAFTEPKEHSVFVINAEPKMPNISVSVMIEQGDPFQRLIHQSKFLPLPFAWNITIDHTVRPGRTISSYIPIEFTAHKEHQLDFSQLQDLPSYDMGNGVQRNEIRGGKLSIMAVYEGGLIAKGNYEIKGTNPGKALIETVLTDPVSRGIACTESSYRQFEAKREGGVGFPVVGGEPGAECGIGLMQLCSPPPLNNSVWNWRANIDEAMGLLNAKRNDARRAHLTERSRLNKEREAMGLPACPVGTPPPLTSEQENRETLRRYNCGREYRWEPRDAKDCAGQWVIKPYFPEVCLKPDIEYVDKVLQCKI